MIGFLKLILCVGVYFMVLTTAECQVTVTNLNGTDNFLCGYRARLECAIPAYGGGMNWKLDGTIIAQCAFGSCTTLVSLPSGDIFTPDEPNGKFYLDIGITHADNGTQYQCDDGAVQNQTTVNIQVPPSYDAFTTDITERDTSITVEAGCFYPSDAGRMDVYEVNSDGTEKMVDNINPITMTPTTTGCTGNCSGPNIYTATGSYGIDSSKRGGNSRYRFKVYHKDFNRTEYAISIYSSAIYNFGITTTLPTTVTQTTSTSNTTGPHPITTPPPEPDCGETCIIIIVVCVVVVVVLLIIIIIVCCCIRKRKRNKATKGPNLAEKNDKKQDQINIPSEEYVQNEKYRKEQGQNKEEHKF